MHKTIFWTVRFIMKWKTKWLKKMLKNQINWFRLYFIADGFIKWKVSVLKSLGTPYSCWHELISAQSRYPKRDEIKRLFFLKRKNSYQSFAKLNFEGGNWEILLNCEIFLSNDKIYIVKQCKRQQILKLDFVIRDFDCWQMSEQEPTMEAAAASLQGMCICVWS